MQEIGLALPKIDRSNKSSHGHGTKIMTLVTVKNKYLVIKITILDLIKKTKQTLDNINPLKLVCNVLIFRTALSNYNADETSNELNSPIEIWPYTYQSRHNLQGTTIYNNLCTHTHTHTHVPRSTHTHIGQENTNIRNNSQTVYLVTSALILAEQSYLF